MPAFMTVGPTSLEAQPQSPPPVQAKRPEPLRDVVDPHLLNKRTNSMYPTVLVKYTSVSLTGL